MRVHWGFRTGRSCASPARWPSRLSHAVGIAYAAKFREDNIVCFTSFGDGATSQGEFHSAMNFAGVFKIPVVFFCENNQYAISLPSGGRRPARTSRSRRSPTGSRACRSTATTSSPSTRPPSRPSTRPGPAGVPTLIEAVTYRMGGHSTSDDPNVYRISEEVELWKKRDPIKRFSAYLMKKGLLTEQENRKVQDEVEMELVTAIKESERHPAPAVSYALHGRLLRDALALGGSEDS